LYEVEDGERYTLNFGSKGTPVAQYLSLQKRYRHLNQAQIEEIQQEVDHNWQRLQLKLST
jgi:pyruvate/2-oxoacid:ferredoxin oxidoreductase beta subunit